MLVANDLKMARIVKKELSENQEISKFLGFVNIQEHWWYHPISGKMEIDGLKSALNEDICLFNKSWDWLMPVWTKFRQVDCSKFDDINYHTYHHKVQFIGNEIAFSNFESAYTMLIKAIKWVNNLS